MPWSDDICSGFTAGQPWLPVGAENASRAVSRQMRDKASMLMLYRQLIALRRNSPALHSGSYRRLGAEDNVMVFERVHESSRIIVILNLSSESREMSEITGLDVPTSKLELLVSTHDRHNQMRSLPLWLAADEGLVVSCLASQADTPTSMAPE